MQKESIQLMEWFCSLVGSKDPTDDSHCSRVRQCTGLILDGLIRFFPEYGLTQNDKERIIFASLFHDIGKAAVPDRILQKPGRLEYAENEILKNHTRKGKKMFEQLKKRTDPDTAAFRLYSCCEKVCMSHHERYDGGGYPEGLKGDAIPIEAQIVGLADTYDELVCERIYKSACDTEEAFESILEGECGAFSPKLLRIFRMCRMEIESIYEN